MRWLSLLIGVLSVLLLSACESAESDTGAPIVGWTELPATQELPGGSPTFFACRVPDKDLGKVMLKVMAARRNGKVASFSVSWNQRIDFRGTGGGSQRMDRWKNNRSTTETMTIMPDDAVRVVSYGSNWSSPEVYGEWARASQLVSTDCPSS